MFPGIAKILVEVLRVFLFFLFSLIVLNILLGGVECYFIEKLFHQIYIYRTSSPNGLFTEKAGFHLWHHSSNNWHSKTGLRSSLAALEAEIQMFKVFAISNQPLLVASTFPLLITNLSGASLACQEPPMVARLASGLQIEGEGTKLGEGERD